MLPFSNLDKKHIAERKIFLENYLNQLCSLSPIAQSAELQEFLAYGGDKNLFARRNAETSVPRIDKVNILIISSYAYSRSRIKSLIKI